MVIIYHISLGGVGGASQIMMLAIAPGDFLDDHRFAAATNRP
jgi:hypothetical protein